MESTPYYVTFLAGMAFGGFCIGWFWFMTATLGGKPKGRSSE